MPTMAMPAKAEKADKTVHRSLQLTSPLPMGPDVRALQESLKAGLKHYKVDWLPLAIDGEFGQQTAHACAFYGWILGVSSGTHAKLKKGTVPEAIQEILRNPEQRGDAYRERSDARKERLKQIRKSQKEGAKAAVAYAKSMIGVIESSNVANAGATVTRKGKKGGVTFWEEAWGLPACFWCLCFASYCVRDIGGAEISGNCCLTTEIERMAKAHTGGWVEVSAAEARAGDIVIFCFDGSGVSDHGELAVGPIRNGMTDDVGGNTSSDEAGSQSNGGGVFAKRRSVSQLTCVARPLY